MDEACLAEGRDPASLAAHGGHRGARDSRWPRSARGRRHQVPLADTETWIETLRGYAAAGVGARPGRLRADVRRCPGDIRASRGGASGRLTARAAGSLPQPRTRLISSGRGGGRAAGRRARRPGIRRPPADRRRALGCGGIGRGRALRTRTGRCSWPAAQPRVPHRPGRSGGLGVRRCHLPHGAAAAGRGPHRLGHRDGHRGCPAAAAGPASGAARRGPRGSLGPAPHDHRGRSWSRPADGAHPVIGAARLADHGRDPAGDLPRQRPAGPVPGGLDGGHPVHRAVSTRWAVRAAMRRPSSAPRPMSSARPSRGCWSRSWVRGRRSPSMPRPSCSRRPA